MRAATSRTLRTGHVERFVSSIVGCHITEIRFHIQANGYSSFGTDEEQPMTPGRPRGESPANRRSMAPRSDTSAAHAAFGERRGTGPTCRQGSSPPALCVDQHAVTWPVARSLLSSSTRCRTAMAEWWSAAGPFKSLGDLAVVAQLRRLRFGRPTSKPADLVVQPTDAAWQQARQSSILGSCTLATRHRG